MNKPPEPPKFLKHYRATFIPSREEDELRKLAHKYHKLTEAFDRTICTGPIVNGAIMPASPSEFSKSSKHATQIRDQLGEIASSLGFSKSQWHKEILTAYKSGGSETKEHDNQ